MEQADILPINGEESQKREKSPAQWQKHWAKEMEAAQKRTRVYKRQGTEVVRRFLDGRKGNQSDRYDGNKTAASKLNLFHKNITYFRRYYNLSMSCCQLSSSLAANSSSSVYSGGSIKSSCSFSTSSAVFSVFVTKEKYLNASEPLLDQSW